MDISTWELTFQELIVQEKPWARWTLELDENIQPNCVALGWKQFQHRAHCWFQCCLCERRWESSQKILCHVFWDQWGENGKVFMRLFAQKCQNCHSCNRAENPEFSTNSIMIFLEKLVQFILQRYYGHGFRSRPVIEKVPLAGPHDTQSCEKCLFGSCLRSSQRLLIRKSSESPFPYLVTQSPLTEFDNGSSDYEPRSSSIPFESILIFCFFLLAFIYSQMHNPRY